MKSNYKAINNNSVLTGNNIKPEPRTNIFGQDIEELNKRLLEELNFPKPKPHLVVYLYKENGEVKHGSMTVMR